MLLQDSTTPASERTASEMVSVSHGDSEVVVHDATWQEVTVVALLAAVAITAIVMRYRRPG